MPPFEKGGAYCFAHVGHEVQHMCLQYLCPPLKKEGHIALHMSVGMSVGRYVGRSVGRYVGIP